MVIQAPALYDKQKEVVSAVLNAADTSSITLCTSRQAGKSLLMQLLSLNYLINSNKQTKIGYFTPYYKLAKKQLKETYQLISYTKRFTLNQQDYEIKYNNSFIKFFGCDNPNAIRGFTFDYIFVDEAAFISEEVYQGSICPTFNIKGKRRVIASTPTHTNTWFYRETKNKESYFHWSYKDNPFANTDLIEQEKLTFPAWRFANEYEAKFLTDNFGVFSNIDEVCILNSRKPKDRAVAGLDIGLSNDFTVLSIFDEYEQIGLIRFTNVDSVIWLNKIIAAIKEYNIKSISAECNFESTLLDNLQSRLRTESIDCLIHFERTTSKTKIPLIEKLIVAFDYKKLKLLNLPIIKDELATFVKKDTLTSYTYQADGNNKDDIVMSLAYALKEVQKPTSNISILNWN